LFILIQRDTISDHVPWDYHFISFRFSLLTEIMVEFNSDINQPGNVIKLSNTCSVGRWHWEIYDKLQDLSSSDTVKCIKILYTGMYLSGSLLA
jgi:hypothetical protein